MPAAPGVLWRALTSEQRSGRPAGGTCSNFRKGKSHESYPQYDNTQQYRQVALPTVWPTILVTFFFGIFGLIPAITHTTRARDAGRPTSRYWAAFGWTAAVSILIWVLLFSAMAASVPTYRY